MNLIFGIILIAIICFLQGYGTGFNDHKKRMEKERK